MRSSEPGWGMQGEGMGESGGGGELGVWSGQVWH